MKTHPLRRSAAALLCWLLTTALPAQPVLRPGLFPVEEARPPAARPPPDATIPTPPAIPDAAPDEAPPRPATPPAFQPYAAFEWIDVNDLPLRPGDQRDTRIEHYTAGFELTLGRHWAAGASVQRTIYSDPQFRDTTDWAAALRGATTHRDWELRFNHESRATEVPLVDTAGQTRQRQHDTLLGVRRALTPQFLADLTLEQRLRFAGDSPSAREWPAALRLLYRRSDALEFGPALIGGFTRISPGADLLQVAPQLQVEWSPRSVLHLSAAAGIDCRTAYAATSTRWHRTIHRARLDYRPAAATSLILSHDRLLGLSYFTNQVTLNTRTALEWRQRWRGRTELVLGHDRQRVHYLQSSSRLELRSDRRRTTTLGLSTTLRQRTLLALTWQHSRNDSSLPGYGFSSDSLALLLRHQF